MRGRITAWLLTAVMFVALDVAWLTVMGDRFYRPRMGEIAAADATLAPALIFYVIYTLGLSTLAVRPSLGAGGWARAGGTGAVIGAMAYATYDLTNQATLKGWPTMLSVVDMAWGITSTALAAALASAILAAWVRPNAGANAPTDR